MVGPCDVNEGMVLTIAWWFFERGVIAMTRFLLAVGNFFSALSWAFQ